MVGGPRVESHASDPRAVRLTPGTVLLGTVTRRRGSAVLNVGALRIPLPGGSRYPVGTRVRVHVRSERGRVVLDLVPTARAEGSERSERDRPDRSVPTARGRFALADANRAGYAAEIQRRGLVAPDGQTDTWEQLLWAVGISGDRGSRRHPRRRESGGDRPQAEVGGIEALRRATANPDDPLQLFNALASPGALHWIVVPLRASFDRTAVVDAVLRVGVQLPEQRPLRAVLDVQAGRWLVYFDLSGGRADTFTVQASDSAPAVPPELLAHGRDSSHTYRCDELAFAPERRRSIDTYG